MKSDRFNLLKGIAWALAIQSLVVVCIASPTLSGHRSAVPVEEEGDSPATLPQLTVDTTPPTGWDGTADATPANSAALTTALAAVNQNAGHPWIIQLTAGVTYTGNFVIQNKTGTQPLIIRTSGYASLPAGTRVAPGDASDMAKVVTANTDRAFFFNQDSHNVRLIGIEVTTSHTSSSALVMLGQNDAASADLSVSADLPDHIIIDRCYFHGTTTGAIRRGITLNCNYGAVIDSHFSDFHDTSDAQAILWTNCDGPTLIRNNYLEGSGENILIGGSDPSIANCVPSDATIINNHFTKPLTWKADDPSYNGNDWNIKNLFEIKNAQRVLIDGNVFENNWPDGQTGTAINIKSCNQDNTAPWSTASHITFTNNIVRNCAGGLVLSTDDASDGGVLSEPMVGVLIANNLFLIDPDNFAGSGRLMFISGPGLEPGHDIIIEHNTLLTLSSHADSAAIILGDADGACDNIIIRDNIYTTGTYGVKGDGVTQGTASLAGRLSGYSFLNNVFVGADDVYPITTARPANNAAVGFTNYAGGDYSLTGGSAYHNAATDGTDIGVDWDELLEATVDE